MRRNLQIIYKIVFYSVILIIFSTCQEPYEEDYLTGSAKLPVVQGSIHDGPGPYTINLSWSSSFKKYVSSPIYGAKVTISDNAGSSELLKENGKGNYVTKADGIKGIVGRKYKLTIKMTDGKVLESPATLLESAVKIDTLYAIAGEKITYERTANNDFITSTLNGLSIYADVKSGPGETKYLKFDNTYIWQYTRLLNPNGQNPPTVYFRVIHRITDLPDVNATILHNGNQEIIKQPIGFLPYVPDFSQGVDSFSAYTNMGWIMCTTVSTISRSAFNYYENISKQLKAGAKIFDPVPSQITGNIKCRSDSTYIVLGLFDVYSVSAKYTGFLWYSSLTTKYRTENVEDPGPMEDEVVVQNTFPLLGFILLEI